jgi:hypothetical protein
MFWDARTDRLLRKGRRAGGAEEAALALEPGWKPTHAVPLLSLQGAGSRLPSAHGAGDAWAPAGVHVCQGHHVLGFASTSVPKCSALYPCRQ